MDGGGVFFNMSIRCSVCDNNLKVLHIFLETVIIMEAYVKLPLSDIQRQLCGGIYKK